MMNKEIVHASLNPKYVIIIIEIYIVGINKGINVSPE